MIEKITRAAFLYLDPKAPKEEFAQCGTCEMFDPEKERCAIHGPIIEIDEDDSCGFYVHGKPGNVKLKVAVTPKESGLVDREVRCENCVYFNGKGSCGLYRELNATFPSKFQLDEHVNAYGCCNAQTPKPKPEEKRVIGKKMFTGFQK